MNEDSVAPWNVNGLDDDDDDDVSAEVDVDDNEGGVGA